MGLDVEQALTELRRAFPGISGPISPAFLDCPMEEWSHTYLAECRDGSRLFLKGTPRARPESRVTRILYDLAPGHVPRVLLPDLLPWSEWNWFVLEDAGRAPQHAETFDVPTAVKVCHALGQLQRKAEGNRQLPGLLPRSEADTLGETVLNICRWGRARSKGESNDSFQAMSRAVERAGGALALLGQPLSDARSTCVHGDLWVGNVAISEAAAASEEKVCFLDWGDALWGMGGLSVAGLLRQAPSLAAQEEALWTAYCAGRERACGPEAREACEIIYDLADLVVHMEINKACTGEPEDATWLLPKIERFLQRAVQWRQ